MKSPVALISADASHQTWIQNVLSAHPSFAIIGVGETIIQAYPMGQRDAPTPLIVVDLSCPEAVHTPFWAESHLAWPEARYVAITKPTINEAVLSAALHAGVHCYLTWADPPETLIQAVYAAQRGERFYSSPALILAVTRLTQRWASSMLVGALEIDMETRQVKRAGQAIELTPTEWGLLARLARNYGRPVSAEELWQAVWHINPSTGTAAQLKNSIKRLRKKIEPDPEHPRYILTTRGYGYSLTRSVEDGEKEN